MCRSNAHGGRRCPSINSDRTRAFNTARRRLARANKALNDYHEANPDIDIFNDEEYIRLDQKLEYAENALTQLRLEDYQRERQRLEAELADLRSQLGSLLPSRLVKTGEEFQKNFPPLITRLAGEFDESKFNAPLNRETAKELGKDGPFGKPHGGLWVAPLASNGRSEWENFIDESDYSHYSGNTTSRYEMKISPDAKVLVIDSWEDYVEAVDSAPREVPDDISRYLGTEPDDRKGLDYEKLGVDLVFITSQGVSQCSFADRGFNQKPNGNEYESLYGWDFASGVVMNAKAVEFVRSE